MRARPVAALVLALAGTALLLLAVRQTQGGARDWQLFAGAQVDGRPLSRPAGTPAEAYLAALAAFAAAERAGGAHEGGREASLAAAELSVEAALARPQPSAQRSQLENLAGVLEVQQAWLGGSGAFAHDRAAGRLLQQAVLDDPGDADAKFNLGQLIADDPQSTSRAPALPKPGRAHPKPRPGTNSNRHGATKPKGLGVGY